MEAEGQLSKQQLERFREKPERNFRHFRGEDERRQQRAQLAAAERRTAAAQLKTATAELAAEIEAAEPAKDVTLINGGSFM